MRYIYSLLFLIILVSCRQFSPRVDLSGIPVDFELYRFETDLFTIDTTELPLAIVNLQHSYPDFFDLYTQGILRIGTPQEKSFSNRILLFLADPVQQEAYLEVNRVYSDFSVYKNGISEAFRHFNYYFPEIQQPDIYTFIGYFNQSLVADEGLLAIALEKYLSPRFTPYLQLGIPSFAREKMDSKYLVSDVVKALGKTEFMYNDSIDNLVNQMIYEGMILYFTAQLIPKISEEILLQFTFDELQYFKKNEAQIWKYLIEQKQLFSSEYKIILRYINDGPFTPGFTDSPSRAGIYVGYRIVQSYMKNNPEVDLSSLLIENDYHKILNRSGYKP